MIPNRFQHKIQKTTRTSGKNSFLFLLSFIFLFSSVVTSCTQKQKGPTLTGTVILAPNVPLWMLHGDLSVVVFMKGTTSPAYLPVAISIYPHPVFPLVFQITQDNVRLSGIKLSGNVKVQARLRLSGIQENSPPTLYTSGTPSDGTVDGGTVSLTISQESHS